MAAQVGLCVAWSETPEDMFCHVAAHIYLYAEPEKYMLMLDLISIEYDIIINQESLIL